jgi:hypothetical protein
MSKSNGEIVFAIEEAPEGGCVARALGHSIFVEADSLDALRDSVRDAVLCHFDDSDRPKIVLLQILGGGRFVCLLRRVGIRGRY